MSISTVCQRQLVFENATYDEVPKGVPSTQTHTAAQPVDCTHAARQVRSLDPLDLTLWGVVFQMPFFHLLPVVRSESWPQVTLVLYPPSQNCRPRPRIRSRSCRTHRHTQRRIFRTFRHNDLVLDAFVNHVKFVAVRFGPRGGI